MQRSVSQKNNRQNLIEVMRQLAGCEAFPFFGTLLGLNRNGDIIPHDDDVDILVDSRYRDEVIRRVSSENSDFHVSFNSHESFLQISRLLEGEMTYVDFYFYTNPDHLEYLIEKWNFFALPDDPYMHMHIPKDLIFPLTNVELWGIDIPMPNDPDGCCEYLYGKGWKIPQSKRFGYTVGLVDHRPILTANSDQISDMILAVEKSEAHANSVSLEIEAIRSAANSQIEQANLKLEQANLKISEIRSELEVAHRLLQKADYIIKRPVSNIVRLRLAQFSMLVLPAFCVKLRAKLARSIEKRCF